MTSKPDEHGPIIGRSLIFQHVLTELRDFASSPLPLLITGEPGVGKDFLAYQVHQWSRRTGAFVLINTSSFDPLMFSSAMFGHRRGAFTGADQDHKGFMATAHGGTLFLNEIGLVNMEGQAKLLCAIESGLFHRLGDSAPQRSEFRVISATNEDLAARVAATTFRRDLWDRLSGVSVHVPPLRERLEDLPDLAHYYVRLHSTAGHDAEVLSPNVLAALCDYDWPGNIRQLRDAIERICVRTAGRSIVSADAERAVADQRWRYRSRTAPEIPTKPVGRWASELQRAVDAWKAVGWDIPRICDLINADRATAYRRLKRAGLNARS